MSCSIGKLLGTTGITARAFEDDRHRYMLVSEQETAEEALL